MISSKPLYGIIGVYIPLSVLIIWAPLPGLVYWKLFPPQSSSVLFDEKLWCLAGFMSALAASCYAGMIKKTMFRHSAADIRGGIAAALAAYAFISIFRQNLPLPQRFIPSVNSIAGTLAACIIWFSVISLREIFNGLELFESFTAKRRGEQLREVMREYSPEMSQTTFRLKRLMISYGIQFIPPCLLLIAMGFTRVSPFLAALMVFVFCAGFLLLGFLGLLRRELAFSSEGISLTIRDRSLPIPVMAMGIGGAALLSLAGSSDTSILPPEVIFGFLAWLLKLLASLFRPRDPAEIAFPSGGFMPMGEGGLDNLLPQTEQSGPWPGWKYVKYGVIVLAISLFLLFMIYPLIRRSFSVRGGTLRATLARWFGDLKKGFLAFWSALSGRGLSIRMKKPDREKLRRIATELLSGKSREVKRSVNLFARLILWGMENHNVNWKPSIAPGEYCGLLAAALRAENAENNETPGLVLRSGELFEKALYSSGPLSKEEEQDFKRMIEKITGNY